MSDLVVHYTFEPSTISGTTVSNAAYGAKTIDGTIPSAVTTSTIYKIGSQSVVFNGKTSSLVSIPTIESSSESLESVTVSFWLYRPSTQLSTGVVSQVRTGSQFFNVGVVSNSNNLLFVNNISTYTHTSANVFPNSWHHIVWIISPYYWRIYVNNVKVEFTSIVVLNTAITRAYIGNDSGAVQGSTGFIGNIDDWRLYKIALSDDQVYEIFDRASYTHYYRFEPEDVTSNTLANLASGIPVNDASIVSVASPNNFTSNSFKINTSVYKSGTSSLYTNGTTGNYVTLPTMDNIDPSGITLSVWYNPSTGSSRLPIFIMQSGSYYWQVVYNQSSIRLQFSLNTYPSEVTVTNGSFTAPNITTNSFSYINSPYSSITGWTITSDAGIIIIDRASSFGTPTLPSGITQLIGIQNGTLATISQTFTLDVGRYTISYYRAGRTGTNLYNTNQKIAVSFGGVSISSQSSVLTTSWTQSNLSVSVSAAGSYTLTFTVTCSVTGIDTTLYLTGVTITPQITELGYLQAQTEYPDGLKIGSDKSIALIRYGGSISPNTWHHIIWRITSNYWAITINGSTTKMYPGSNATPASVTMNTLLISMPTSVQVSLLTSPLIANAFVGYYDDFRFYNRVLTDSEVNRLYTFRCLRTNYYDKYGNDFIRLFKSGTSGLSLGYENETNDNITAIFGGYTPSLTNTRLTTSYVLYTTTTLHLVDSISGSTVKPITRVLPGQIVSSTIITTNPYVLTTDILTNTVTLNKSSGGSAQSVSGQSVAGYYYVSNGIAVLTVNPSTSLCFSGNAPAVGNMLYHTNIPIGTYIKSIYETNLEEFTIPVVTNESFSSPAIASNSSSSIVSPYTSITGWTISGTPEIFIMNKTSPFGVATPPSSIIQWLAVKTSISGQTVTITQPITFSTTGKFTLSLNAVTSTSSSTTNRISMSIAGYSTNATYPGNNLWSTQQLSSIFVVPGTYTLTITITTGQTVDSYMYFTNVLFNQNTTYGTNTVTASIPTSFLLSNTNINIPITTNETMKWYIPYTNANFYNLTDIPENSGYNFFSGTSGFDDFVYKFSNLRNTNVPYIATGTYTVTNHSNGFYTIRFTDYGTVQFMNDASSSIQLLVVGSGGGGGASIFDSRTNIYYGGGGGGGGQVQYFSSYKINKQAIYAVDVGIGGETSSSTTGGIGAPCFFGDVVSLGGKGGGITTTSTGGLGGTGGGSGGNGGTANLLVGTNGTNGSLITFNAESATYYGGGGAGGKYGLSTTGNASAGLGGGGSIGGAGTNGLGGGGAGANASSTNTAGGAGGKGVVLIYVGTPPDSPTGLISTTKTNTTIAVSFNSSIRLVTTYTITAEPTSGSAVIATFSSGTTYTITGLIQNTTYSISLIASNSAGISARSNIITVTTLKTISDAPTIGYLDATNNVLEITFGTSEQELTTVATYAVSVEPPFVTTQTYKTTNYLAKIPGLIQNTFYKVYATGTATYGITPTSVTTFKTKNISDPVSSLVFVSRTSSNLVFSFNRPTTNDGGVSPILYYTFNEGTYTSTNVGNLSSGQTVFDASLSTGTINTSQYRYGNSSLYNTTPTGFPFKINSTLNFASYSYLTICIWLYPTRYIVGSNASNPLWIYSFNNTPTVYGGMLYAVRFQPNGTQSIICGNNNYTTNTVIPLNMWSHLTYVQQFSNTNTSTNTLQVYLNGSLQQTITNMNTYNENMIATTNYIGSENDGTAFYNGWIDDFRVYDQALSQSQIQKVVNNNLPLNSALTQYNLYSKSLYNYDKTSMIGLYQIFPYNVSQNALYNYAYSSLVLDASLVNLPKLTNIRNTYEISLTSVYSQHIKLPAITIDTGGFTFACWFRSNNTATWGRLFDIGTSDTNLANTIFIAVSSNVLKYGFYSSGGGNITGDVTISSTNVNTNTYNHLVFIVSARSGSTCTVSAYLNGNLAYNASNISYPPIITRSSCFVGRSNYPADPYLNGGVFDIYLWLRPISGIEATYLYNNPSSVSYQVITDITSPVVTQTVSGLQGGEKYTLAISSANSDGESFSIPLVGTTLLIPSTPTNFSVNSVTDISAVFQFTAPTAPVNYYNLILETVGVTDVSFSHYTITNFNESLPDSNIQYGLMSISVTNSGSNQIALVSYGIDFSVTGFVRYFNVNGTWTTFDTVSISYSSNVIVLNGAISTDGTRVVLVGYLEANDCRIFYADSTAVIANTSNVLTLTQINDDTSGFFYDSISLTNNGNILVATQFDGMSGVGNICFSYWTGFNYGALVATLDTTPRLVSSVAVSGDGNRIVYACTNDAIFWASWNGFNYGTATQIPYSISTTEPDPKKVIFLAGNSNIIAIKPEYSTNMKYAIWTGVNYGEFITANPSNQPITSNSRMFISDSSYNIYSIEFDTYLFSSAFSLINGNMIAFDVSFNTTTYSLNTLTKDTSYTASLKAINADGESGTTAVSFTTLKEPDAPTNMVFTGFANTQITFSFTPPSGTITRYDVSAISQTQTVSATFSSSLTSYQLTGLLGATDYLIFLYAVNPYGKSYPLIGSAATISFPDSVTNFTATALTDTSIRLDYTPPSQTVSYYSLTYAKRIPDMSFNVSFANSTTVASSAGDMLGLTITQPNNTRLAVFASFAGVRYSRITNNSWGTYSTPTVSFDITPNSSGANAISILPDASRLVCSFGTYASANHWIYFANPTNLYNGTSTSLSFTRILDITLRSYYALALTFDGSRLIVASYEAIYFSTWNGSNYSAFTKTFDSTLRSYTGICVTPNGNKIAYCAGKGVYWALWNGNNYTSGTQILGPSSNGIDSRKISFLGADSDFIVLTAWDGINQYTTWNGTNYAALTNIPTSALPNTNGWGLFVDTSGNTANIYLSPYANSNVYRSVLTFSKSSNTVAVSGSSTTYTIELLYKNTTYDISFVTVNSYGSSFAALTSATTLNTVEQVTGVSTSVTNTTATISFNAPPQTITYYSTTIDASGFIYTKTYNTTSVSFVGLVPSRTYLYNISAFSADSSSNVTSSFTTPTIPTAPTTPVLITESPYAIDVSFGLIEQSLPVIYFNGTTQVASSNASDANFSTGTIECWFRTNANNQSTAGIIVKPAAYGIFLNNNILSAFDWTASVWRSTGYTLNHNVWYHVAFTFQSGITNGSNIYLNGDLISTFTYTLQSQDYALYFGSAGGWQYYTGYISEVRIWNTVRTASQIIMYYNKNLPIAETGLLGYYPMVESAGSIIYNAVKTGGIANFTLSNSAQWTTDTIDIIDLSNTRYILTATPTSGTTVTSNLTNLYGSVGGLVPNTAYTVTVGRVTSTGTSSSSSGLAVTTDATSSYNEPDNLLAQNTNVLYAANLFPSSSITVTGQTPTYRNGTYNTSASATFNNDLGNYGFFRAFNLLNVVANGWIGTTVYNSSDGTYIGTTTTTNVVSSSDISGEWIQIQLPYKIVLKSVGLMPRQFSFPGTIKNLPVSMVIVGSNNGINWNIIYTNTNPTYSTTSLTVTTFTITGATIPYSHIRLIARTVGLANSLAMQQLNYNGDIYLSTLIIPPYPLLTSDVTTTDATVSMYRTVDINNAVYYYKLHGYGGDLIGTRLYNYASGAGVVDASLVNNPVFGTTSGYNEIRLVAASSQYVQLPSFTNTANGLSISCWFRGNATSDFSRICDFATGTNGNNDMFIAVRSNDLCYRISGTTIYYGLTSSNINNNVYYHLAFVLSARSGSTCTVTAYLNNVLKYTGTNITYPSLLTRTFCSIGKSSYASNATFNGAINNFFMWNRALSTTEISALYSTTVVSSTYRIYAVSLNPRNSNVISSTVATTSSTISSTITGLSTGQPYALYATNITDTESSPSSILYVTVPGPGPTLTLSSSTTTTATFTITPTLAYFILSYTITVIDTSTSIKLVQIVTTTTPTITGLTQNTVYTITVVANTRTVASSASNTVTFTTAGPPAAPAGFAVETSYSNISNSNILTTSFTKYTGTTNVPDTYFISGRSRTSDVSSITFATNSTLVSTANTDHLSLALSAPGATRLALLAGLTELQAYRILNGSWGSVINVTVTGITFVDFVSCAITSDGTRAVLLHGTNGGNTLVYHTNTTNLLGGSSTTLDLTQTLETTTRGYRTIALTKDGSRLVCGTITLYLYLATWNGSNYTAFTGIHTESNRFYSGIAISSDSQILAYATKSMLHWSVWNGTTYADEKYALMTPLTTEIVALSFMGDSSNVLMYTTISTAGYVYWNGNNYTGVTPIPTTAIASGVNRGFVIDPLNNIYIYRNGAANVTTSSVSSIVYSPAPTFTKTITASRLVDTSNLLMYYKMDGTGYFDQYLFNYGTSPLVTDASFVGNPLFTTTAGYKEIQLVAASLQHVQLPSFTIGTSGLTVAFWFRANSSGAWSRCFEFAGSANGINSIFVSITSNNLNYVVTNSSGAVNSITIQSNINNNTYRHFAFVIGPQSGSTCNITGYINGVAVYNGTNLAYPPIVTRSVNYIGRSSYVADPYFNGGFFDIFIWNRAISAAEVTNLYNNPNGDFSVYSNSTTVYTLNSSSLGSDLLAYYRLDGKNVVDRSLYNYGVSPIVLDASLVNNPQFTTFGRYNQITLAGSQLQYVGITTPINFGVNGYSVACWFRKNTHTTWKRIFSIGGNAETYKEIAVALNPTSGLHYVNGTGEGSIDFGISGMENNVWYHIAYIASARSGTTCTITFYLNGALVYTGLNNVYPTIGQRNTNRIGGSMDNNTLDGGIFDFVVWNRPITASEVTNLYNNPNGGANGIIDYKVYDISINATNVYGTSTVATSTYTFGTNSGIRITNTAYNLYRFISSGAITIPGAKTVYMVIVGGGGNGANTNATYWNYSAAGGGGGGVRTIPITQTGTTTYYINVAPTTDNAGFDYTQILDGNKSHVYYGSTTQGATGGYAALERTSTASPPGGSTGNSVLGITDINSFSLTGTLGSGSTVNTNPTTGITVTIGSTTYTLCGGGGGATNTSTGQNPFGAGFAATSGANPSSGGANTGGGGGGQKAWASSGSIRAGGGSGGSGVVLVFYT